jgi:hypothetical protein
MSSTETTLFVTSITSTVSSSSPTSSRGFGVPGGVEWGGLKDPRPNHPAPMGSINGYNSSSSGDSKPIPPWGIVLIVLLLSSVLAGLGYIIWCNSKPTLFKREREEARREIDLERASLEAEAKWQRSLKQAEVEAIGNRRMQKGEEIEMKKKKPTQANEDEGERVVVGKLGKGDDMV